MSLLNRTQLEKLKKEDLFDLILSLQNKYEENLQMGSKLDEALAHISKINETMSKLEQRNIELESTLLVTKNVNTKLVSRIEDLERLVHANAQYSRRECLEVAGIPPQIGNEQLEDKVCDIFSSIDVKLNSRDIEACHRIKNDRTIVKFANRKDCVKVLQNRKKLKDCDMTLLGFDEDHKIYVNESLCPYYRTLFWKCRKFHELKKIYSYWSFNGTIKVKLSENGRIHAITHIKDLEELFPDDDFSDIFKK